MHRWVGLHLSFSVCQRHVGKKLACIFRLGYPCTALRPESQALQARCVFELATFLRYRSERRIQVLPVEMSILTLLIGLSYSAFHLVHRVWDEARNLNSKSESETSPWITVLNGIGILAAVACLVVPFYNYLGLELAAKIRRLPAQLRMFDAREARCYCCSVPQILLGTGWEA